MPKHSYGLQGAEMAVQSTENGAKFDMVSCHYLAAIGLG